VYLAIEVVWIVRSPTFLQTQHCPSNTALNMTHLSLTISFIFVIYLGQSYRHAPVVKHISTFIATVRCHSLLEMQLLWIADFYNFHFFLYNFYFLGRHQIIYQCTRFKVLKVQFRGILIS